MHSLKTAVFKSHIVKLAKFEEGSLENGVDEGHIVGELRELYF